MSEETEESSQVPTKGKTTTTLEVIMDNLDLLANMTRLILELQEIILRELGDQKGLIVSFNDNWEIVIYNPTDIEQSFFKEIIAPHNTHRVKTRLSA